MQDAPAMAVVHESSGSSSVDVATVVKETLAKPEVR